MILKDYVSPEVEIIEVAVEKGYAISDGGGNEFIGGGTDESGDAI